MVLLKHFVLIIKVIRMECDVDKKFNDDNNLGDPSNETANVAENAPSKKNGNGKGKRKRPRTKALRQTIREKVNLFYLLFFFSKLTNLQIEIALCTSDSPIQDILETDMDCVISAPLSSIMRLLKLDMDEYRRLSCKALISIGNLSKFFSITGDSTDTLRLVLKVNDLDHSSTVVYVDNLPDGCKVDSLKRWASTFGTVVFVHPIMMRKTNPNKSFFTNDVSTSTEASSSAFHQLLRKKAAKRRRKKLKSERKQAKKRLANSISRIRSKTKWQRKRRKSKKLAESSAKSHLQKTKNEEETVGTGIIDAEKSGMCVDDSNDVVRGEDEKYSRQGKRKRRSSHEVDNILFKKSKTTADEEKKVGKEDDKSVGFDNVDPKKASVNIDVDEENHEIKDGEMEICDGFTAVENIPQLTVVATEKSSEKTFRDVGTDVPEEFLLGEVGDSVKKRKRVHRQKRRNDKSKNCNPCPKKYFHDIQVYSLDTFHKLRARYLELQKQQMVQLKASLKKKGVSNTLSGLTKKEWKKKRGRNRLMMRAAKLREEHENFSHLIPEEDKLADIQFKF
ncbi:hypothetical protein X798_02328 [Onchocerca flexuosa]|uniref:RRM domain-containing protein n=1 Tax=Onchocerca flexuosa TaxID=387005 RepID=A0A238BZF0_9BILA|nr:hypothetical protein X798_02328 [Onchocerca flexuosa]